MKLISPLLFAKPVGDGVGFVYIIGSMELGRFKIGMTHGTKHPEERCRDIQVHSPVKIMVLACARVKNARSSEKRLHDKYKDCRLHGEWFQLTTEQLQGLELEEDELLREEPSSWWCKDCKNDLCVCPPAPTLKTDLFEITDDELGVFCGATGGCA